MNLNRAEQSWREQYVEAITYLSELDQMRADIYSAERDGLGISFYYDGRILSYAMRAKGHAGFVRPKNE